MPDDEQTVIIRLILEGMRGTTYEQRAALVDLIAMCHHLYHELPAELQTVYNEMFTQLSSPE